MIKLSDHIPDDILLNNKPLEKILVVLEGLLRIEEQELEKYSRRFLYPLITDMKLRRRYVDEWRAEYLDSSNEVCLECLYINYSTIYREKGTFNGLKTLLTCLLWINVKPEITLDEYTRGKPLILFDDMRNNRDWLPEGEDLANALLGNPVQWCPTLLDDTWEHTYATITITVTAGYVPNADYIAFMKSVIKLYIPMLKDLVTINLNFI